MISNIKNEIMKGTMDELIEIIFKGEKKDLVVEEDNIIYQLTSSENQEKNENINNSIIKLGECENILKKEYNISQNQSLLIFKIDYLPEGSFIPIIEYEIYNPIDKTKLNLDLCKKYNISLNIPVEIDEDKLYKYDPKSEYYTDVCNPSSTESKTDILMNDRHIEFNENNMSLCERNCTYIGYNITNKKAICICDMNKYQPTITELSNQNDLFYYEFEEKNGVVTMKCYKTLFTKEGLIRNIGSYILFFIILLFMASIILFYKCGYNLLEDKISKIYSIKVKTDKSKKNHILETKTIGNKYDIKEKKKKKKLGDKTLIKNRKVKNKKIKKSNEKKNKISSNNIRDDKSNSKIDFKKNNLIFYNGKEEINESKSKKTLNNATIYNDFDLNLFSYEEAIKLDKRSFFDSYKFLIKTKHPIIFHFCLFNDYNSIIIKVCLFFLSVAIYYFINTLFFDESTIHKIYKEKGEYNFIFLIPHISFSFIISHTLSLIFKFIFLSERNLFKIKEVKNIKTINNVIEKEKRNIVIKYICFFVLSLIFLFFFWYYLSSFGAVFQNTQTYIIENTLISFCFALVYPFIFNILPVIIRIYSLSHKNRKFMYKISKFLQFM